MRKTASLAFLLLVIFTLDAKSLKVGLFYSQPVKSVRLQAGNSTCHFLYKGNKVLDLPAGQSVTIEDFGGIVRLIQEGATRGLYAELQIRPVLKSGSFILKSGDRTGEAIPYNGSLSVRTKEGNLQMINEVGLEDYVSAVVESEIGLTDYPEMLKVQAILIRTYAMANHARHQAQGFSVCDGVHCQAYYGHSRFNPAVHKATAATKGQLLVGKDGRLVLTVYHSNCGGKTAYAADAWSKDLPELQSVIDTFCSSAPHARWDKKIPLKEWQQVLTKLGLSDTQAVREQLSGNADRVGFIGNGNVRIPLKQLRKELELRSSYFAMSIVSDTVLLDGRGYGHGVGLCQEGAIAMARQGYKARDILQFYFCEVHVTESGRTGKKKK